MGWETRGGKQYYYRATKVNGRVVKTYVGTGEVGEMAARLDAVARGERVQQRDEARAARDRVAAECELVKQHYEHCIRTLHANMAAKGEHFSNGAWRKKRVPKDGAAPAPRRRVDPNEVADARARVEAAANEARARHKAASEPPPAPPEAPPAEAAPEPGDLPARALARDIDQMAAGDAHVRAALRANVRAVRAVLAGPHPSAVVKVLADDVAVTWLAVHRRECADDPFDDPVRHLELAGADRRFFAALRFLQTATARQAGADRRALLRWP